MSENRTQSWEDLARAARVEQDPNKLIEIVEELNRVLEERSKPKDDEHAAAARRGQHSPLVYC